MQVTLLTKPLNKETSKAYPALEVFFFATTYTRK